MCDRDDLAKYVTVLRSLSDDATVFEALGNLRRRTIIRYIGRLEPAATVSTSELARVCAAVERELSLRHVDHTAYRHAYQSLRNRDIPALTSVSVLERHGRKTVHRGGTFDRFQRLLTAIDPVIRRSPID